jgi:ethanolamine utilization microcompartment shell protein EutL
MSEDKIEIASGQKRKDRLINVRVTDAEYVAIDEAAKSAGMSVSAFFRSLLLEGAGVRPIMTSDDRLIMAALLEDMRMIGINLNQVARSLNASKGVHPSELDINLGNVQRIQGAVMLELRALSRRAGHERRGEA